MTILKAVDTQVIYNLDITNHLTEDSLIKVIQDIDNLNLGNIIPVVNKLYKAKVWRNSGYKIEYVKKTIPVIDCLFLGYVYLSEGFLTSSSYDSETGYYDPPYFKPEKTFKCWVVQPISKQRRFLKSFYTDLMEHKKDG